MSTIYEHFKDTVEDFAAKHNFSVFTGKRVHEMANTKRNKKLALVDAILVEHRGSKLMNMSIVWNDYEHEYLWCYVSIGHCVGIEKVCRNEELADILEHLLKRAESE